MFLSEKYAISVTKIRYFAGSANFAGLSVFIPLLLHRLSEKVLLM